LRTQISPRFADALIKFTAVFLKDFEQRSPATCVPGNTDLFAQYSRLQCLWERSACSL